MTESEIQKQIITYLKLSNYLVFRMNSGKTQYNVQLCPKGTPDLLAISPQGKTLWIEVKTASGKLRESQVKMIADLESRGQKVIIARSVKDVLDSIG